jgi:DNA-nicking Smr family endonuclease
MRLTDLGQLKRALAEEQTRRLQALEEERRRREAAEREATLFRATVGQCTPLPDRNRRAPEQRALEPVARQRMLDEQAALHASLSDEIDIEALLDTDSALSYRRPGVGAEVPLKLRRGYWSIKAQIDLHGLRVDEARLALVNFLNEALKSEFRCVRVIHGKGLGSTNKQPVLKGKVLKWLVQRDEVLAFTQARPNDGGAGALVVLLKGTGSRSMNPANS